MTRLVVKSRLRPKLPQAGRAGNTGPMPTNSLHATEHVRWTDVQTPSWRPTTVFGSQRGHSEKVR